MTLATPGDDFGGDRKHDQAELSGTGRHGRLMRLAGWIDLDSRLSVSLKLYPLPPGESKHYHVALLTSISLDWLCWCGA